MSAAVLRIGTVLAWLALALVLVLVLVLALPAAAQDPAAAPTVRGVELAAAFSPDPYSVPLAAGGPIAAESLYAAACAGGIPAAPQVVLDYRAGGFPLYVMADSASDVSLAVHAPNGRWYWAEQPARTITTGF